MALAFSSNSCYQIVFAPESRLCLLQLEAPNTNLAAATSSSAVPTDLNIVIC